MAMDIQDDQKVVVYKDGVDQYEGLWGNRDEDYDGDFYVLRRKASGFSRGI